MSGSEGDMDQQKLRDFFNAEVRARKQVLERVWGIRTLDASSLVRNSQQGAEGALATAYSNEAEKRYADIERLILLHVTDVDGVELDIVKAAEDALGDCMESIHDDIKNLFRDDVRGRNPPWPISARDRFFDAKHEFAVMWLKLGIREKAQIKLKERAVLRSTLASAEAAGQAAAASKIAADAATASASHGEQGAKWTKRAAIGTGVAAFFTAVAALAAAWAAWHPTTAPSEKVINEQVTQRSAFNASEAK